MDIHTNNVQMPVKPIGTAAASEPEGYDIVRVLWRWKFLPILGALIGMAIGYLHYSTLPHLYMASALIQVVTPLPQSSRNGYPQEEVMQLNKQDESLVISSERVLRMAAESMKESDRPAIRGLDAGAIAAWISTGRKLSVSPAAKDANTALININFVCEDAELSSVVVNAVVDGYSQYLSEEYETVGRQVYQLLSDAQLKVSTSITKLMEKSRLVRDRIDMPILWTENGPIDPYAKNIQHLQDRKIALTVEENQIKSKLDRAKEAIKVNPDLQDAVLMWLAESEIVDQSRSTIVDPNILESTLRTQRLESERMEREDMLRLRMEEQQYLDNVGESHPALAGIRKRIALLQKQIEIVREAERAQLAEMDAVLKEKKRQTDDVPAYKPLSTQHRLEKRMLAMEQSLASLGIEKSSLDHQVQINETESKKLQKQLQDIEAINTELEELKKLQGVTLEKLKQIELVPTSTQRALKKLNLPKTGFFYGPKIAPYLLGGGALGFLVLAGLAVLLDLADKSFRSPEDIAAEIGAPVLGHIPAMELDKVVKKPNQTVDSSLCTIHHSRGRVSEAYRSVRTGLFFSNRTGDLKVIQVTSPVPGDGKSTLSSNLAVTMAQSGRNVLLIDADFRRPRIAKLFNIDSDTGMATAVAGACELDDAIHASSIPFLSVMPGGKRPSNPAELLSSQRFSDLMNALREKFDIIIVDTPPLLAVSDPSAIAAVVDGVVLTMRLRRNVKPLVTRASRILESVDANLLGIVVNGVSQDAGYGYNYGYRDYRYAYQYRYGYGYKGYGSKNSYYGTQKYLEESHDVDTDHVLAPDDSHREKHDDLHFRDEEGDRV